MDQGTDGMKETRSGDDWQARAGAMIRRQRSAWIGTIVTMLIGSILFGFATELADNAIRSALMIAGLALIAGGLLWGTVIYMQVIDEQERDANLWATYVGLTVYMVLFVARFLGDAAGTSLPLSHDGIFLTTIATTLAIFTWKRFF